MTLRVPSSTSYDRLERGLGTALTRVQKLQQQLSSGQNIDKLSDDPVGAAAGMRLRAETAAWDSYNRSADDAQATLGVTGSTLQSASTLMTAIRQVAVSGSNGALDSTARAAAANQISAYKDQLADLANTQYLGRAVFGGHRATAVEQTGTPPAYAYAGDSGSVSRQVSPSVTMAVNLDGRQVFGFAAGTGQDVFATLDALETAVRTGDQPGLVAAQTGLAARAGDITAALGTVGSMMNRVSAATAVGQDTVDRLAEQRSKIEDIDIASTVLHLQEASNAYTAALGAVAKADLPSLANFLK